MKRTLLPTLTALLAITLGSHCTATAEAATGQHSATFEITTSVQYQLFLPENYSEKEKWPMIVFLHGAGERGDNIEKVKVHGPPKIVESKKDFPFIVLSPQCLTGKRWSSDVIIDLIEEISSKEKVDNERVYLTGLSMGGFGTWEIASRDAYRFAAIAPICGGGNPSSVRRMGHLPIWVFHGGKDRTVPLSASQEMVDALVAVNGNVKFTVYPEAGHDSWTESYNNPELYSWFLKHKKQERPARRGRRR